LCRRNRLIEVGFGAAIMAELSALAVELEGA
jgi:hypothetical protein